MANRSQRFDVVVIGGGLSGLVAAAAARLQGAEVALLAEGRGMLELSSGSIDLLAATPAEASVQHPWDSLAELPAAHPYGLLGVDAVRTALDAFQTTTAQMGHTYRAEPDGTNQALVTAIGHLRPTYLAAPGAAVVRAGQTIWLAGIKGMREFHPGVAAAGLQAALPGSQVIWNLVDLPQASAHLHPVQLARLLEEPAYRDALAHSLAAARPQGRTPDVLLLPAVLGLDAAAAVRTSISTAVGMAVGEVSLLSPSIPGLRLATLWTRHIQRLGVTMCLGAKVTGARCEANRVVAVTGQTAAGPTEYRAGAFVLAAGGLLGQGLVPHGRTVVEPIFGLPVDFTGEPGAAEGALLAPGGHKFVRTGIPTDAGLRPDGWRNIHICGRMLSGYDPYAEGCGGGVAVASGWRAGSLAGGAAL